MNKLLKLAIVFSIVSILTNCDNLSKNDISKPDVIAIKDKNTQTSIITSDSKIDTSPSPSEVNKVLKEELDVLYEKAYSSFHNRKYNLAIDLTNDIIEKDNKYFKAYNIKGITLVFTDNFDEGIKNIDMSLLIEPNDWYCRFNKALAYSYNHNFEEALIWYDKSLEKNNYVWSYYGKAAVYGQLKDVKNAVEHLKIAINMKESIKALASGEKDFNLIREEEAFKNLIR